MTDSAGKAGPNEIFLAGATYAGEPGSNPAGTGGGPAKGGSGGGAGAYRSNWCCNLGGNGDPGAGGEAGTANPTPGADESPTEAKAGEAYEPGAASTGATGFPGAGGGGGGGASGEDNGVLEGGGDGGGGGGGGGIGGAGGAGGGGGGGSFGVYLDGGAQVAVELGSTITPGEGGAGGTGGAGGNGGAGGPGGKGSSFASSEIGAGGNGGAGGSGGAGSGGGGGLGGPSYAIFTADSASSAESSTDTVLGEGKPGPGGVAGGGGTTPAPSGGGGPSESLLRQLHVGRHAAGPAPRLCRRQGRKRAHDDRVPLALHRHDHPQARGWKSRRGGRYRLCCARLRSDPRQAQVLIAARTRRTLRIPFSKLGRRELKHPKTLHVEMNVELKTNGSKARTYSQALVLTKTKLPTTEKPKRGQRG